MCGSDCSILADWGIIMNFTSHFVYAPVNNDGTITVKPELKDAKIIISSPNRDHHYCFMLETEKLSIKNRFFELYSSNREDIFGKNYDVFQRGVFENLRKIINSKLFKAKFSEDSLHCYVITSGLSISHKLMIMQYMIMVSNCIINFNTRTHVKDYIVNDKGYPWDHDKEKELESRLHNVIFPREFDFEYFSDCLTVKDIIQ